VRQNARATCSRQHLASDPKQGPCPATGRSTPRAPATCHQPATLRRRHGSACVQLSSGTTPTGVVPDLRSYATLPGLCYDVAGSATTEKEEAEPAGALDGSLCPPSIDIEVALPCRPCRRSTPRLHTKQCLYLEYGTVQSRCT
jgi:hypothetical protein